MKLYFNTRKDARAVAKSNDGHKAIDSKNDPSIKGSRWAVDLKANAS